MSSNPDYRDTEPSTDIARLLEIMARLRDPETGCNWDVAQSFKTIIPYTIEEAYEVKDAIDRDHMDDLCDELGDLLLQVVYHAQMASERDAFSFDDVVHAITKKMIGRHPHVFGTEEQKKNGLQPGDWERIKAQEKQERQAKDDHEADDSDDKQSLLASVPQALPTLKRAVKLQKKAATVGFDWNDVNQVFAKLEEEIGELKAEIVDQKPTENALAELGDVLFVMANIARHLKLDPESALDYTNRKFINRFNIMEQLAQKENETLDALSLDELEDLWQTAKTRPIEK